jgi:hypothetical protein
MRGIRRLLVALMVVGRVVGRRSFRSRVAAQIVVLRVGDEAESVGEEPHQASPKLRRRHLRPRSAPCDTALVWADDFKQLAPRF